MWLSPRQYGYVFAKIRIPAQLDVLVQSQNNVISRAQANSLGFPPSSQKRMIRDGYWKRLFEGIYLVGPQPTWLSWAWAGHLKAGPRSMLGGASAAYLWGLTDVPPSQVQVLIPGTSTPRNTPRVLFSRRMVLPTPCGRLPVIPLPETVLDMCAIQPKRAAHWISQAKYVNKTFSLSSVREALDARTRYSQRELVRAMLSDSENGVESVLEKIYLEHVEKAHGLPTAKRQVGSRYRCDADYGPVLVELDGRLGHEGIGVFRDMKRDNYHQLRGKMTLRYGWDDCTSRPCEVAREVSKVLFDAGISFNFRTCERCRTYR